MAFLVEGSLEVTCIKNLQEKNRGIMQPSSSPDWPDASTHASTKDPKEGCEISPGCAGESH